MSIQEAEGYLTPSREPQRAYDLINLLYSENAQTFEELLSAQQNEVFALGSDYFTAGVAYLANRSTNPHMEDVGTEAWRAVNQKKVSLIYAVSPREAARVFIHDPRIIETIPNGKPAIAFFAHKEDPAKDIGLVFIPPELIIDAKTSPLDALARMVFICSQLYDFQLGRLRTETGIMTNRAYATEAQFLIETLSRYPEAAINSTSRRIIEKYPLGLQSIPSELRYWENPKSLKSPAPN